MKTQLTILLCLFPVIGLLLAYIAVTTYLAINLFPASGNLIGGSILLGLTLVMASWLTAVVMTNEA